MDYEKKYKEALERAKKVYHRGYYISGDIESVFPELAESEDEKIRKAIICGMNALKNQKKETFAAIPIDDCIAWLEKQGKLPIFKASDWYVSKVDGKIHKITTDKVEPKFKPGDWIVFNGLVLHINENVNGFYRTVSIGGVTNSYCWDIDNVARLWTIQDAKDGDVLCDYHEAYDNPLIFILKKFEHVNFGLVRPSDYSSYCYLTSGDIQRFKEGTYHHKHNIKPATKEQRDLLFQKMKEAECEWDAEKKKLKKIEQKSADTVEPKFLV